MTRGHFITGGATITVFSSIAMTGMKLITREELNYRNASIIGLGVALGIGITLVPQALSMFPAWVTLIFGKSAVVVSTIVTVVLNQILPKSKKEE